MCCGYQYHTPAKSPIKISDSPVSFHVGCGCTATTRAAGSAPVWIKNAKLPPYIREMNVPSFTTWLRRRDGQPEELVPQADRLVPLVAQAGMRGLTRGQIGNAIDLAPDVLDGLLAGLVEAGLLTVSLVNGIRVYRAAAAGGLVYNPHTAG